MNIDLLSHYLALYFGVTSKRLKEDAIFSRSGLLVAFPTLQERLGNVQFHSADPMRINFDTFLRWTSNTKKEMKKGPFLRFMQLSESMTAQERRDLVIFQPQHTRPYGIYQDCGYDPTDKSGILRLRANCITFGVQFFEGWLARRDCYSEIGL